MTNPRAALFFIFGLLSTAYGVHAQTVSPDKNSVTHFKARVATTDPNALTNNYQNAATTIQYFDGLGRPIQTVGYRATPQANDLMQQAVQYDNFGRPVRTYLPAPAATTSGIFQPNPQALGQGFYGDTHPFEQIKQFDNSPLNRVRQSYGAGQAWQTNDKYKETFHEVAGSDVRRYTVDGSGNVNLTGAYPNHSLYKTRLVDEQGHTSIEIKDTRGRLVESQQQDEGGFMVTHYVYDGLDRPLAVIQPQGYALNSSFVYNSNEYANYLFTYKYGDNGLAIRKHVPGGGWTEYVYDKGDRIVLEQTARQAQDNRWSFTKYDVFSRVTITGELTNGSDRVTLQSSFDTVVKPFEVWNGSSYTNQSFPISYNATDERQTNYYDTYTVWQPGGLGFQATGAYNATSHYANSTGLLTGSRTRDPDNPNEWFYSVFHYDNKGRILQNYQTHLKGGGQRPQKPIRTDFEYNFPGEILREKVTHAVDGLANTETVTVNEYDHVGRLLKVSHGINGAALQELCRYGYDEAGRLKEKTILPNGNFTYGGAKDYITRPTTDGAVTQPNTQDIARKAIILEPINGIDALNLTTYAARIDPNAPAGLPISGLQKMDYTYHIRGMLRGVNLDNSGNAVPKTSEGDLFSLKLEHETAGFYDGNIGKQSWKNDTEGQRQYSYTYDPAKRLKSATYTGVGSEDFSLPNLSYDKNGNITNLQRKGNFNGSYDLIDNLNYNYGSSGNRLVGVSDGASGNADVGDFRDNGSNTDYTYWADGSLKSDANKGIYLIEYDTFLKKVRQVNWSDGRWLKFSYDGGGKLIKRSNSAGLYWEYVGNMVFRNGQFYQLSTPEGRAVYENNNWSYEFEYRDHQNNLRVAFKAENGQLVKTQMSTQDPWGLEIQGLSNITGVSPQNFRFQNQEQINDFGLNWNFYKYRFEDPQLGRFFQVDPLSEKYVHNSTFAFSENKVISHVELEGLEAVPVYPNLQGELYKSAGINSSTNAKKVGKTLLTDYLKAYATIMLMALPIEDIFLGGLGLAAKEIGIGVRVEGAMMKGESALAKELSTETKFIIDEKRVKHIFREADGHFTKDTPDARKLINDTANKSGKTLGDDKYGNQWSAQTRSDGSQIWTQSRNGKVINAGINKEPRTFNSETGLSAKNKPNQQ